jgi:transglutaminase-like putative cysteine protease
MSGSMRARLAAAPAEGWLSLFLVAVLAVSVAWSLDDAALVLGQRDWTDFLAWVSLGGVIAGFIGARARWSRPVAHLIGAAFAALIVPLIIGSILDPAGGPAARYQATASSVVEAVIDFAVRGLPVTRQTGHYLLVLGLLCWANGQFAASSVFRHGRPIGPIIVLGTVLVANMSATSHDWQIWYLVLFSMAALFLLTRLHALEERATWIRRRIGDPSTVGSLYLRGGTVFILIAIFGSLTLTASARSAPLAGFWDDARPALVDISQWLQRIIPAAPDSRPLGVPSFGQQVTIGGTWSSSNEPALEILRTPGEDRRFYWRATTYDKFTLFGWSATDTVEAPRPAGASALDGTEDQILTTSNRTAESFRITPQSGYLKVVFSPIDPISVNQPTTLTTSGDDGFFQALAIEPRTPYTVQASVETIGEVAGGLTENRLRAAGRDYPPDIVARYTSVPTGAIGFYATALLADFEAKVKTTPGTPYDFALAMVTEFQNSSRWTYSTKIPGVCDKDSSTVECFAHQRIGFCEHFASTMAILLRKEGIPTRLVEGFLPGSIDVATGRESINANAAHAWVEVYFPGIGWKEFDPTGGGRADTEPIPLGAPQPIPTATPKPSAGAAAVLPPRQGDQPSFRPGSGRTTSSNPSGNPAYIIIAIVLLAAVLAMVFLAYRRGPRGAMTPDGVYASVAALARRFGFGPRPTQTAYEYATALGDVLPGIRPELQTVATAKVEVAYGRHELGDDRLKALGASYRRLRVSLLRLAFRRRDRPRGSVTRR